jgi:hypothetical protein
MSYKSAKRVNFAIDMTDLSRLVQPSETRAYVCLYILCCLLTAVHGLIWNSAVYPAEPSELPIKVCQAQTTLSQPSVDKLMASIRDLQPGRTMMLRLCRMVSRLINTLAA